MANTVTVEVKADTTKAQSNIGKFGAKVKGAMPALAAVGAVTTGAAMAASKLGDEFKMAERIIAAGTGASGGDLKSLQKSFQNVFKDMPNDSAEVAQAMADLNTEFGLTGTELETATRQMLNASTAMGVDLGSSIKTVADGMQIFGVDASELGPTMDALAAASQATGVPIAELAAKVQTFGPVMKNAGFSMEEATAFFGSLEQNGIDVTRVMPGINASMRRLSEGGVKDLKGAMEEQILAIQNATSDSEALNLATDAFGSEGAQRMSVAIRNGNLDLGLLLETMEGSEGTINTLAENTRTTADKFDIMKNNIKSNLSPIGDMASTMGPLLIMIPGVATAVGGLSTVISILRVKMALLNLSMGPILIVVLAIAAAIAIGILIWKNWDTIVEIFWKTVEKLKEVWDVVWTKIKSVFDTVVGALSRVFNSKLGWLLPGGALLKALFLIRDNWDTIWNGMLGVVSAIANPIIGIINSVIGAMNALFGALKKVEFGWEEKKKMGITVLPAFQFAPFQNLPTIPMIPSLAAGGIVTSPTLAMLGERGREAVIPLSGAGAGGMGINITINGDVFGFDDFEDRVQEAVRDGARRGGFQGILNTA